MTMNRPSLDTLLINVDRLLRYSKTLDELASHSGMPRLECLLFVMMDEMQHIAGRLQNGTAPSTKSSNEQESSVQPPAQNSKLSTLRAAWDAATPGELQALFNLVEDPRGKTRLDNLIMSLRATERYYMVENLQRVDRLMGLANQKQ
jgi:hypothetical protein